MSTVQFEPKITPDFQIDWQRPSSQQGGGDPFAELLKRHFDADPRPRSEKLRDGTADPLSGRPPRVIVTHPRTLRGEAKRVDETQERCLTEQTGTQVPSQDEEPKTCDDAPAAADAQYAPQDENAAAETEADTTDGETAEAAVNESPAPEAVAPVIVAVQCEAEPAASDATAELVATPVPALAESDLLPKPLEVADATPERPKNQTDAAAEQQAMPVLAEANLEGSAASLVTGETAPADDAALAVETSPAVPAPMTAKAERPLPQQMVEAVAQEADLVAAPQAKPDRAPADIKLRSNGASRPAAVQPATAVANPAPQTVQPHASTILQSSLNGESGTGTTASFEEGLSDTNGQGWAVNLAQGAVAKRPDFVAQLRQHLQNLPAHEQVAIHLQRAVREGTNKFSIQLSPAELGTIHVKLEIDEEKRVTAAVTVERPSTLELLQRDTKGLERALHNAGLNMEGGDLSFSLGRGDQEFAQDLRQSAASAAGAAVLDDDPDADQPEIPAAQVRDTAAGVVNLQV